jgi:glycosyltransferase involved in cell wall biosynthesis
MSQNPVLSIIIPVYNIETYIEPCLNSIVNNSLKNIEVIIVDDGSTDLSREVLKKYDEYAYISVFTQENKGVSAARNYGLSHSTGKWVWFIDGDDEIQSGAIEYIEAILEKLNADILMFRFTKSKSKFKLNELDDIDGNVVSLSKEDAMKSLLNEELANYPWNKIFKKELFENIEFPIGRNYTEDMAVIYKLYQKANNIYFCNKLIYYYRQRNNSLGNAMSVSVLKDAALSHYELYIFLKKKYPEVSKKFEMATIISIISYFHRLNLKEIKNYPYLVSIINSADLSKCNLRYKIEIQSFRYCYIGFKFIGKIGYLIRKRKK